MNKIYTLGTSNRSLDEFLEILKNFQIKVVVDVRYWFNSLLFLYFKKENLGNFLKLILINKKFY